MQHIKMNRRLEFTDKLDINLDDIDSYPPTIFQEYLEKQKYDNYIKRKDEKIEQVSDRFHEYLEKRADHTIERRKKRGLQVRKR